MLAFASNNPWIEEEAPQVLRAIATISATRARADALGRAFPNLRSRIETLATDLDYIEAAFRNDVRSYRSNRALTAVHLPALTEFLELIEAASEIPGEHQQEAVLLEQSIDQVSVVKNRIKQSKLDAGRLPLTAAVDKSPDSAEPSPSRATKFLSTPSALAKRAVSEIGKGYDQLADGIQRRGSGAAEYVGSTLEGLVDSGRDLTTRPIATQLSALSSAARTAMGSASLNGIVLAIIFPPAIPLALGVGILEGTETYTDELAHQREKQSAEAQDRKLVRDERTQAALRKIQGKSPIVSVHSPHLHVTIDTDKNLSTGTVLSGRHIGKKLESVPTSEIQAMQKHAPDEETRKILEAWLRRI